MRKAGTGGVPADADSRNFSEGKKPHKRASQDGSGFSCILGTATDSTCTPDKRLDPFPDDIEDEEKFLYGDDDGDSNNCLYSQKITMSEKKEPVSEKVKYPPTAKLKYLKQSVKPDNSEQSVKPENLEQSSVEYDKIRDLLKTIGLDIGMTEIDKLAARTEERLHGKKPAYSPNHHSVANHKATSLERQKHSLSPFDSFPSPEGISPVLKSDYNNIAILGQNKDTDKCEQSGVPEYLIPSAPPSFLDIPPGPISGSCHNVPYASTFTPTQFFPNSASLPVALPGYVVYQPHMGYATSNWYAQQVNSVYKPEVANHAKLKNKCTNRNLRIINTVTISNSKQSQDASTTGPYFSQPPQSKSGKKRTKRKKAAGTKQTSPENKILQEKQKLERVEKLQHKKLFYQRTEVDRLSKQQAEMLQKKRKEEDPLLVELTKLIEYIANNIAKLELNIKALKEKQGKLDKVIHGSEMSCLEKSQKLSSENKVSSENNLPKNPQSEENT